MRAVEEQEARLERAASIVARERSPVLFASFFLLFFGWGGVVFASIHSSCQPAGSLGVVVFVLVYRAQRVPDTRQLHHYHFQHLTSPGVVLKITRKPEISGITLYFGNTRRFKFARHTLNIQKYLS